MHHPLITIPRLTLEWTKGQSGVTLADRPFAPGPGLVVGCAGFRPEPLLRSEGGRTAVVIGTPVLGERIDPAGVAHLLLEEGAGDSVLARLNGQFVVALLDVDGTLTVAGDRFNGVPMYWADLGDRFVAAHGYVDLVRRLRREPGFAFDGAAMWEYVWFQRLLLDKTHDSLSRYLMPATRLRLAAGRSAEASRYWRPDFTKRAWSGGAAGDAFVERLQASLRRRTSDGVRYGLFLSGGHDSRTLAAALEVPFTAFTVAFSDNYEVDCARRIAKAVGAGFRFLRLGEDHFSDTLDQAAELCGGMYSVDNALFLGLEREVRAEADVVFHGHGLDYMFHGMYIPSHWVELMGRPTFFRRLDPLDGDVVGRFLDGVPYRLKYVDLRSLVRPAERARMEERLRASVAEVVRDGADVCQTDADRWEYLITHALGRHYSHPNISSKATCAEQRTVTFDNDLFDLYLSLPPELRIYGQTLRHAMRRLAPEVARLPTGNWGIAAGASPLYKTGWLIGRKLLRHLTGIRNLRAPVPEDRTWPDRDTYLATRPAWQEHVRAAVADDELAAVLPFLDWDEIRRRLPGWIERPAGAAGLLVSLLTLQRFLVLCR